jgi:hypothetical protein
MYDRIQSDKLTGEEFSSNGLNKIRHKRKIMSLLHLYGHNSAPDLSKK